MLPDVTDFCRLVLLRHPELDSASRDLVLGGGEAELSRRGRARAAEWTTLLEACPPGIVFSGPARQCALPARVLADARNVDLATDERLRDQRMGAWEGRAWEDVVRAEPDRVRDFFAEFGEHRAPQGESLGEAVDRVLQWWTAHAAGLPGKTAAVVLPGNLLSGFVAAMLGMRLSRSPCLPLPHGGIGVVDVYQNGVRVSAWNPDALSG